MTALVIESALRGLLFAAVVGAGLSLLRVRHVPVRKAAWSLVLVASVAMPLLMRWPLLAGLRGRLGWVVPVRMNAAVAPAGAAEPAAPITGAATAPLLSAATPTGADRTEPAEADVSSPIVNGPIVNGAIAGPEDGSPVAARRFAWPPLARMMVRLYLAIAGVLLLRLLFGLAAALRLWITAAPVSPLVAPDGNVRASSRIASPVTVGSGIVLPAEFPRWERRRLRMVLAHERSHVRQLDFWLQLLAGVYTAAFWFSPLGWWLRRELAQLGEAMSDCAGMDAAESGSEYAQVVLEFAAMPRRRVPGVAMASAGNLTHRIDGLLNERRFRRAFAEGRRRALASLLLIPAALFAATALIRVPAAAAQAVPPNPATAPVQAGSAQGPAVPAQAPAATAAPRTGQAFAGQGPNADQVTGPAAQAPAMPPMPAIPPAPVARSIAGPDAIPATPPRAVPPPPPPAAMGDGQSAGAGAGYAQGDSGTTIVTTHRSGSTSSDFDYHASPDGNAWAVASGTWSDANLPAGLSAARRAEIERAQRMANGPFLWFSQRGKSYVVTDPVAVGRVEGMFQAIGALSPQELTIDVPNLSEIMAQSQAAMAKAQLDSKEQWAQSMAQYQADMKAAQTYFSPAYIAQLEKQIQDSMKSAQQWMSPQEQAEVKANMARMQANLEQEEARWNAQSQAQMQVRMAEAQKRLAEIQQRMKEEEARWNAQSQARMQARMAAAQQRLAEAQKRMRGIDERGIDRQVQQIIQDSMANGAAHPLQ